LIRTCKLTEKSSLYVQCAGWENLSRGDLNTNIRTRTRA